MVKWNKFPGNVIFCIGCSMFLRSSCKEILLFAFVYYLFYQKREKLAEVFRGMFSRFWACIFAMLVETELALRSHPYQQASKSDSVHVKGAAISKVGSRKSEMESRKTLLVSAFVFCSPLLFAACKSAGEQSASLQLVYSSYMIPIVYRYIVSLDR